MVIDQGKKTARLTCSCSDEFMEIIEKIATIRGITRSELMYEYVVRGIKADVGHVFMGADQLEKPLKALLTR